MPPREAAGLSVGGDGSHRHTLDVEIRRPAQKVLAGLAAAHGSVVAAVRYPLVICTGLPKCSRMHCSSTTSSSSRRTTSLPLQANSRTLKLGESCRVESRDMEYSLIAIENTTFLLSSPGWGLLFVLSVVVVAGGSSQKTARVSTML